MVDKLSARRFNEVEIWELNFGKIAVQITVGHFYGKISGHWALIKPPPRIVHKLPSSGMQGLIGEIENDIFRGKCLSRAQLGLLSIRIFVPFIWRFGPARGSRCQ